MMLKSFRLFAIGLLAGLAVALAAFLSSVAQASDSWVIDGIGYKSHSEDRGES